MTSPGTEPQVRESAIATETAHRISREPVSNGPGVTRDRENFSPTLPGSTLYKPELDALRFFAFFGVFLHHSINPGQFSATRLALLAPALSNAFSQAVSLFFFLSAFLITTLLDAELAATRTIHIRAFYVRRVLRIWPLYYVFFAFCIVLGIFFRPFHVETSVIAAFSLLAGNWIVVTHGWSILRPSFGALWSISIEEQYYAFCPWLTQIGKRKGLVVLSLAAILLSYITLFYLAATHQTADSVTRPNTLVQVQYFAAGTLLALLLSRRTWRANLFVRVTFIAAGLIAWTVAAWFFDSRMSTSTAGLFSLPANYLLVLAGTLAIFLGFYNLPAGYLPKPIICLGKISYGLYVYHVLVIIAIGRLWRPSGHGAVLFATAAAKVIVNLAVTIAIAKLSYVWLEKPFLVLKDRFTLIKSRPA